jgi:hypothetical protein
MLGPCYGSSTWYACMSDYVVIRKGAAMAVASERVTSMAINQPIDAQEHHAQRTEASPLTSCRSSAPGRESAGPERRRHILPPPR